MLPRLHRFRALSLSRLRARARVQRAPSPPPAADVHAALPPQAEDTHARIRDDELSYPDGVRPSDGACALLESLLQKVPEQRISLDALL